MSIYLWAFLGGLAGTWLMDRVGGFAAGRGITTGADISHVGRWFLGMPRGRFAYPDIATTPALAGEVRAGWYFHYLIGGGAVALGYPLLWQLFASTAPGTHLLAGLAYGLASLVLLWAVMLPAFGWGWFGLRGPEGSKPLLAGVLTHLAYGLGLGGFMAAIAYLGPF